MFETKMGNFDSRHKLHVLGRIDLVELGQDLASVRGKGHEDAQVGQRHERHIVLGIGSRLGVSDQIYSILLCLKPSRMKISISHELRIIYTNYGTFKDHSVLYSLVEVNQA